GGWAEAQVRDLKGFNVASIPKGIFLLPKDGDVVVLEGGITSDSKSHGMGYMEIQAYRKYWDHKFGAGQYFNAMKEALAIRKKTTHDVKFHELEDDGAWIWFR